MFNRLCNAGGSGVKADAPKEDIERTEALIQPIEDEDDTRDLPLALKLSTAIISDPIETYKPTRFFPALEYDSFADQQKRLNEVLCGQLKVDLGDRHSCHVCKQEEKIVEASAHADAPAFYKEITTVNPLRLEHEPVPKPVVRCTPTFHVFTADAAYTATLKKEEGSEDALRYVLQENNSEYPTLASALDHKKEANATNIFHTPFPFPIPARQTIHKLLVRFELPNAATTHAKLAPRSGEYALLQPTSKCPLYSDAPSSPSSLYNAIILCARIVEVRNTSIFTLKPCLSVGGTCLRGGDCETRIAPDCSSCPAESMMYALDAPEDMITPEASRLMRLDGEYAIEVARAKFRPIDKEAGKTKASEKRCQFALPTGDDDNGVFIPKGKEDVALWFAITYRKEINKEANRLNNGDSQMCKYVGGTEGTPDEKARYYEVNYDAFCNVVRKYTKYYDACRVNACRIEDVRLGVKPTTSWNDVRELQGETALRPVQISFAVEIEFISFESMHDKSFKPSAPAETSNGYGYAYGGATGGRRTVGKSLADYARKGSSSSSSSRYF